MRIKFQQSVSIQHTSNLNTTSTTALSELVKSMLILLVDISLTNPRPLTVAPGVPWPDLSIMFCRNANNMKKEI